MDLTALTALTALSRAALSHTALSRGFPHHALRSTVGGPGGAGTFFPRGDPREGCLCRAPRDGVASVAGSLLILAGASGLVWACVRILSAARRQWWVLQLVVVAASTYLVTWTAPEEWEARVVAFFDRTLGG